MNPEISSTDRIVDRVSRSTVLDPLADALQPAVRRSLDGDGAWAPLKSLLHGTPLGHLLHPALTDVPIGAWTMAAVFDGLSFAGISEFDRASDVAIVTGIAGAVLAAATGLAEWADTKDEPKRLGMAHASLNTAALMAYAGSLALRAAHRRRAAIGAAYAGFVIVGLSAYLGGELSYNHQIGVKHTARPIEPSDDFEAVLDLSQLAGTTPQRVDYRGIPVLLSRDERHDISAVAATCTHRGGPLEEGTFADGCVKCPWHGGVFSLADGAVREGPPVYPLARFEVRVRNERIELRPRYLSTAAASG